MDNNHENVTSHSEKTTNIQLDGCIVWNAHNTVLGSKHLAICTCHLTQCRLHLSLIRMDSTKLLGRSNYLYSTLTMVLAALMVHVSATINPKAVKTAKQHTISMSFFASCMAFLSLISLEASHVLMLSRNLCTASK